MSNLVNVKADTNERRTVVTIDVTDEGARSALVYSRHAQASFAEAVMDMFGYPTGLHPLVHQGKRGVSNAGFRVVYYIHLEAAA